MLDAALQPSRSKASGTSLDIGLISVATATPPHLIKQAEVIDGTRSVFGEHFGDFDRIAAMFASAGIEERYLTCPSDWYYGAHGWPERMAAYTEGATALFIESASKALAAAGLAAEEVDTIVTVSSTGVAAPSIEARAMRALGFRHDVRRVPVFGLGCAGGVAGLAIGAELAAARPGSIVLMVTIELCSLAVRRDQPSMANMVALCLFGDGAAATVLSSAVGGRVRIVEAGHHTWPNTLDIMGWKIDEVGFGVIFDQSIPAFAKVRLGQAIDKILGEQSLTQADIGRFVCHPGGRKVVEAIEDTLALEPGSLDHEREVLRRYGNMSAPTALFVLERALNAQLPERSLLMALGPGFTVSTVTLDRGDL
jgi:alkylresorcinol/alkylpyrone synthase